MEEHDTKNDILKELYKQRIKNYLTSDLPAEVLDGLIRKRLNENFDYYVGENGSCNGMRYINSGGLMRCRSVFTNGLEIPRKLCTKPNGVGNFHDIMPFRTFTERTALSEFTLDHE